MALTPRQERFVAEYLIDLNATQAAIRAGYAPANADVQGPRLLGNVGVSAEIARRQAELASKHGVTQDRIIQELAKLGFSNMKDYMRAGADGDPYLSFADLTRDQAAALCEVTVEDFKDGRGSDGRDVRRVKFKLADKRAPLVDLGKHLGMFKEAHLHEHTGPGGGPIEIRRVERVIVDSADTDGAGLPPAARAGEV